MKKILIVKYDQFGYSAAYHYYSQYLSSKYVVDYLSVDYGFKKIESPNINIIYIDHKEKKYIRYLTFIFKILQLSYQNKYDSILICYFKFVFFTGIFIKNKNKIIDIRTGDLSGNRIIRKFKNLIIKFNTYPFYQITTLSKSMRETLKLSLKKTRIVPLGAIPLVSGPKEFKKISLLYVGTFNKRNIEMTIEGLALYLKEYSDVIGYDIIGFGKEEETKKIKTYIIDNNLTDIVTLHGRMNHQQLIPYFKKANIGVCFVPNTDFYNIQPSTKLFEYALSGLFTIATNTHENSLFISDKNGVLCEDTASGFAKALRECHNKKDTMDSNIIYNSLQEYHWESIVENKLTQVIENKF